jgi:glycosyltransferase involved in cell wall biosynthesis
MKVSTRSGRVRRGRPSNLPAVAPEPGLPAELLPDLPEFSVVVPCFNEEGGIEETVRRIREAVAGAPSCQIIVVNDGSTDGTRRILQGMAAADDLQVVEHSRNRGYGAALKSGIRVAATDLIAITDADGTYPNERLPELVALCADYDMVVGARVGEDVQYSKLRSIPKYFLRRWMSWIARQDIPDINSGMRVFRKSTVEKFFRILPDTFSFTATITLAMLTNYHPVLYVPISYKARLGRSKIRPIRDTLRFILLILRTGVYFAPVRFFGPMTLVLLLLAGIRLAYDTLVLNDITDTSLLLFLFAFNTGMLTLLADMIDKRASG